MGTSFLIKLILGKEHNTRSKKSKSGDRKKIVKTKTMPTEIDVEKEIAGTPNEKVICAYLDSINQHESLAEMLEYYKHDKVRVTFNDSKPMSALRMSRSIRKLVQSFADFHMDFEKIEELEPGEVMVEALRVSGTHTATYQPGKYPPIEATHTHVVMDEERMLFTMKEGKIVGVEVVALGSLTGPIGMYMAIGGTI